jgi:hypothetical protein
MPLVAGPKGQVPQTDLRPLLASPLFASAGPGGGVDVSLFSRAVRPASYRDAVSAWTFHLPEATIPVDRSGKTQPTPAYDYQSQMEQRFFVPEKTEPSVPLVGRDGRLRLLTIQCAPGAPKGMVAELGVRLKLFDPPRCDTAGGTTTISLYRANQAGPATLTIHDRYVARTVMIENLDEDGLAPRHLLVLVRYALERVGGRAVLTGYARLVGIGDDRLYNTRERSLGVLSSGSERTVEQALLRISRLFPMVGDVNGDGVPDLVIADTGGGVDSLAFPSIVPARGFRPVTAGSPAG